MRPTTSKFWRWNYVSALLVVLLTACDIVSVPSADPETIAPSRSPTVLPATAPPAPTPLAATDLLAHALAARDIGDYDAAADDLSALLATHSAAPEARPAQFYLAESFALRRRWAAAAEALRTFLASGPQDDLAGRALFWLARCQEEAGEWDDAVSSYARYRALKTPLEPYAHVREAALQQAHDQLDLAAAAFEAAATNDMARGERAGAYEKAIALRRQLGQPDQALADYRQLLAFAEAPDYRARILGEAATLAQAQGTMDEARGWLREIAEQLPASAQALDAVTQLLADPQGGLASASAARVYDLHARYADALNSYDAAIAAASGEAALELRRQRSLVRRATGDFTGALDDLANIGAESPNSAAGRQSQLDWVQTKGFGGDTQAALDGYRQFAQTYPTDTRAPEALSRAVVLLERLTDMQGAIAQRLDLAQRYPSTEQAHDALEEAGWALYRAGQLDQAQRAWEALSQQARGVVGARAAFWAARLAQQQQQDDAAHKLREAALNLAPDSYYGARAGELLGRELAQPEPLGTATTAAAWRAAEDWLATWSGAPASRLDERGYPADVLGSGAVQRALALAEVGLMSEATAEWNTARAQWRDDPTKLYLLARLADSRNVPYIALGTTSDLLARAPASAAPTPAALRRLLFPTPYLAVVTQQAREFNLDPRALYALLRQESLFNPQATSWVGARGLAQVMPTTAQGIAQHFGISDFDDADLYRPVVSIRFGAYYLSSQLAAMNGSLQGALAAYNGGPGNAQRWASGTTVADPDAFAEEIDYEETRSYVKLVYGYYGAYQRLYAK